ncbi:MAG TPA: Bax inhibitor-1/YccA family protein [Miltoncostaeaceae bacterium]|nr:Bax inhibitor-1/YccA family protein [Miltoncostaeaceae bacterium]
MAIQETGPGAPLEYGWGARPQQASVARTVFAQVMFLVAVTVGFFAAGAWLGRDLTFGWAIGAWIGALVLVIAMSFSRKAGAGQVGMLLLFGVGVLFGMALGPTLAEYAAAPDGAELIARAAGLTGLFIGGLGTVGYLTKRDLSWLGRVSFFALLGLILFGVVMIFVQIPNGQIIWSVLGLVIFAGYTVFDFWRMRRAGEDDVPLIALSIFLDVVNVFLFILTLLSGDR